jgi:hypothetical protein
MDEAMRSLFVDHFRIVLSSGGKYDGGDQNKSASEPSARTEFVAEKLDTEDGAQCGFDIEEDSST